MSFKMYYAKRRNIAHCNKCGRFARRVKIEGMSKYWWECPRCTFDLSGKQVPHLMNINDISLG